MKVCRTCHKELDENNFKTNDKWPDKLLPNCKKCNIKWAINKKKEELSTFQDKRFDEIKKQELELIGLIHCKFCNKDLPAIKFIKHWRISKNTLKPFIRNSCADCRFKKKEDDFNKWKAKAKSVNFVKAIEQKLAITKLKYQESNNANN